MSKSVKGADCTANATNANYGWSTQGDRAVINGQAILSQSDHDRQIILRLLS